VAIVRALVLEPPLVLADEPTGNLDTQSANEVFDVMRRMHAALKASFLLVTHDPRRAARCDRVIEPIDGRIERDVAAAATPHPEPADARTR
jgi:lipoprotein-releasing system ATP-binding protein